MKLTLPLPPNRANAREHWRVTHRKKKAYYAEAQRALMDQRLWVVDMATGKPRVRAERSCTQPVRPPATPYVWAKLGPGPPRGPSLRITMTSPAL